MEQLTPMQGGVMVAAKQAARKTVIFGAVQNRDGRETD